MSDTTGLLQERHSPLRISTILSFTVDPVEPVEPIESVDPIEPVETVEPLDPLYSRDLLE